MTNVIVRKRFGADRLGTHQRKMLEVMITIGGGCWPGHYRLLYKDILIMQTLIDRNLVVEEQLPGDLKIYRINEEAFYGIPKVSATR